MISMIIWLSYIWHCLVIASWIPTVFILNTTLLFLLRKVSNLHVALYNFFNSTFHQNDQYHFHRQFIKRINFLRKKIQWILCIQFFLKVNWLLFHEPRFHIQPLASITARGILNLWLHLNNFLLYRFKFKWNRLNLGEFNLNTNCLHLNDVFKHCHIFDKYSHQRRCSLLI